MRGIDYVQIPTSLLAQVDSAVGGKTAINVAAGKNMVGTFYQPTSVIADPRTLQTLPVRELRCGYAEIVKYALIRDRQFLQYLQGNYEGIFKLDNEVLSYVIETSCRIKAGIVAADEYEHGCRKWLNFGHTFAHAMEALCGYNNALLHGEAVAIGMVQASWLSVKLGFLDEAAYTLIRDHLSAAGLPICPADISTLNTSMTGDLIELMRHDKKASNTRLSFVVLEDIGHCATIHDVAAETVRDVIEETWQLST
jgi:3-dehydroquinate synthase